METDNVAQSNLLNDKTVFNKLCRVIQEYYFHDDKVSVECTKAKVLIKIKGEQNCFPNEVSLTKIYGLKKDDKYKRLVTSRFTNAVELEKGIYLLCNDNKCALDLIKIRDEEFPEIPLYIQDRFAYYSKVFNPIIKSKEQF